MILTSSAGFAKHTMTGRSTRRLMKCDRVVHSTARGLSLFLEVSSFSECYVDISTRTHFSLPILIPQSILHLTRSRCTGSVKESKELVHEQIKSGILVSLADGSDPHRHIDRSVHRYISTSAHRHIGTPAAARLGSPSDCCISCSFAIALLCVCVLCYCSGCSICTGLMGLRADRFNPLIGFPVSGFPSPGLNLGGGVLILRVSRDLDRTTCE